MKDHAKQEFLERPINHRIAKMYLTLSVLCFVVVLLVIKYYDKLCN